MRQRERINLSELKEILPPIILRSQAETYLNQIVPGMFTKRSLEALDSRGKGCKRLRIGTKIGYKRDEMISWLESQITILQ